ncbi:malonate decarboxylase holo-[acyl-carrier-protein] synthase [Psychrobacter aestuarii]|uniref:Phosphoribosyl-dephospho-CoA transferase MdcG C-terminal domain-containing protein n=1 Tax=Psychrobacter aestuarii TaxID=556327 RepID=A0ABN0VJJ8_9GAMM|nr:malonate decarboxylase holo-[acyl-carrier-protein] synthase [Psychrobacter aestuarii]
MQRHDLVYLQPHEAYAFMNDALPDSVKRAIDCLIETQHPLTVCRQDLPERIKVATSYIEDARKYRLALSLPSAPQVVTPPLALAALLPQLPSSIRALAQQFITRCTELACHVHVYGSFANQYFTSLPFVRPSSDLDLLLIAPYHQLSEVLLAADTFKRQAKAAANLTIDGEVRIHGRMDVSFHELTSAIMLDIPTILVKTVHDIQLQPRDVLLGWNTYDYECFIESNPHCPSLSARAVATS